MFFNTSNVYAGPREPAKKATYRLRTGKATYPDVFITIRYDIDEKTGLFKWKDEDSIHCYFSPYGWDSSNGFNAPTRTLTKEMTRDRRQFSFSIDLQVTVGDATGDAKVEDSGISFSLPKKHGIISIRGTLDWNGQGHVRCNTY